MKTARNVGIAGAVAAIALASWGLANLGPAVPSVDRALILTDSVRYGDIVHEVRGSGTLVPERVRWITPQTNGRIERLVAVPGEALDAGDVILEMSSPDQQIATMRAQQQLREAQLSLASLRATLTSQRFTQEINVASARTAHVEARQRALESDSLFRRKLISPFENTRLHSAAEEADTRYRLAREQLALTAATVDSQIAVAASNVDQLRAIAANEEERLRSLVMRAPEAGVIQDLALQPGQWVNSGTTVARIVQPGTLKAVLRVPESQAQDVQIGQEASINTRTAVIRGRVARKDAAATAGSVTVDVALEGPLPPGAVPDLQVDGSVLIERMPNVLHTGRPVSGSVTGSIGMFRLVEEGAYAERVAVQLGRSSTNTIEILSGLEPGDRVILSDMARFDNVTRVRIR